MSAKTLQGYFKKQYYILVIRTSNIKNMNWLNYLLQVNLYLILFYGFYRILLRMETFFNLNRGYLVASAALAFFIPLIQSEWVRSWFVTEQVSQTINILYDPQVFYVQASEKVHKLTLGDFIAVFYIIGILIGIARFGGNLVYLGQMMKRRTLQKDSKQAFSFFNILFVSKELKQRSTIMKHEFVHIRQLHSADVMLFELIAIFNWFNPVVYLYKSSIKHIHEFIADEVASRNEASKADYAMLLFQEQFGVQAIPLTNNFFNSSLLKLRIKMLHKERSNQTAMMKYGLIAPLFILMIIVSSATLASRELEKIENVVDEKLEEVIVQPSKTAREVLLEDGIDLSKALIISPALLDEVTVHGKKDTKKDTTEVFNNVEQNAEFPGGMEAFTKYLKENIKYPESAQKANITGKVYIEFTVNTDGSTSDYAILKGIGYGCDDEAQRVLKSVPNWIAGKQSGRTVRSKLTIPINFQLGNVALVEHPPIYILDGKEIIESELKNYNQENIEKVDILKAEEAIKQYGKKGKNGVVVITSKKK